MKFSLDILIMLSVCKMLSIQIEASKSECFSKPEITTAECCVTGCSIKINNGTCECPNEMFLFNGLCVNEGPESNRDLLRCINICPSTHYGLAINDIKLCVSCSSLCKESYIFSSCTCQDIHQGNTPSTQKQLIILLGIVSSVFLIIICILIWCLCKRRGKDDSVSFTKNLECQLNANQENNASKKIEPNIDDERIDEKQNGHAEQRVAYVIAMDAQMELDKKTRYSPDPTATMKCNQASNSKSERQESAVYENYMIIKGNAIRNRISRMSRAFTNFRKRKSENTNQIDRKDSPAVRTHQRQIDVVELEIEKKHCQRKKTTLQSSNINSSEIVNSSNIQDSGDQNRQSLISTISTDSSIANRSSPKNRQSVISYTSDSSYTTAKSEVSTSIPELSIGNLSCANAENDNASSIIGTLDEVVVDDHQNNHLYENVLKEGNVSDKMDKKEQSVLNTLVKQHTATVDSHEIKGQTVFNLSNSVVNLTVNQSN